MASIAIIGYGWLGAALGNHLVQENCVVYGTTTSPSKLLSLQSQKVNAFKLLLPEDAQLAEAMPLWQCDTIFINIPPGRRDPDLLTTYPVKVKSVLQQVKKYGSNSRVIFVSSTGVYPNTGEVVDETCAVSAQKDSSKALIAAEELVRSYCSDSVILRMAGLVGPNREPGRWFVGKVNVPGGDTPVNMVHQEDCIQIVGRILSNPAINGVYNVCADKHPSKRDFYEAMAKKIGVLKPIFEEGFVPHKIVDNRKLKNELGYSYGFFDPLTF